MYLNCKTWFSFHYGTYATQELIDHAQHVGVQAMALTNINSTADCWDFVLKCSEKGIKPLVGVEVRNGDELCYVLLARNNQGLAAIQAYLSAYKKAKQNFPVRPQLPLKDLWVIYPYRIQPDLSSLTDSEYIGVNLMEIQKYGWMPTLPISKMVVLQPVTYQDNTYYAVHKLLRAMANNTLWSKLQPSTIAGEGECFYAPAQFEEAFSDYAIILQNTQYLIDHCAIEMDFGKDKNKQYFTSSASDDGALLRKLALEGCIMRYGKDNKTAIERVERELAMIHRLGFNAYFLIVWDLLRYAYERGFYHVGRGSGANSVVAYCLRITDVDPIQLNLYFERFLNPYRSSPPDFDIDFSWQDRDAVYEYLFMRHGQDYVCLLGMYSTLQRKAIIRELGKVFGLPKGEIDRLLLQREWNPEDKIQRWIKKYGALMVNFPTNLSIHAGGVLISELPLVHYATLELPPKGLVTAHMDMFEADRIGLYKFDILSQRGLGHIKDAIALVAKHRGQHIDIHQVQTMIDDPQLAAMIERADTIGCFYIESPAMRQLLAKLRCSDYLTLVAASSIIRPGVAQSGMMKQYIERFHDPSKVVYLHPKMKDLLSETFGVMVYQEDVIAVAHHFGGISLDEADILRRAMSGKYRSENKFEKLRQKFFANCTSFGYDLSVTTEVWRQMESFGGYSFAKGHSASFAVESYQSLYLKTYFPREFYVAVINNFGGFYSTEFYFHELSRHIGAIALPCVNHSAFLTDIQDDQVYVGWVHLQGLEERFAREIVSNRLQHGCYVSLADFIQRLQPAIEQMNILIRIGAFSFTGIDKKSLLWAANFSVKHTAAVVPSLLFELEEPDYRLPTFTTSRKEDLQDELDILGFLVGDYFEIVDPRYMEGAHTVADFPSSIGQQLRIVGRLVTTKETRTLQQQRMAFGTFLDVQGNWLDTVHFPAVLARYPFLGKGFYELSGQVSEEFGVYSLTVTAMHKIGFHFQES